MKTRRAEAFWVEARGRWQINVQREGRRKTFTSSTPGKRGKHEAEAKADAWLEDFNTDQTISHAWELFCDDLDERVSAGTMRMTTTVLYKRVYRIHIEPFVNPLKKLSAFTLYDWQSIINKSADESKNTCTLIKAIIVMLVIYSERRGWSVRPVEGKLEIPANAGDKRQKRAMTDDELNKLMALDEHDSWMANSYKFIVLTGLRRGECLALDWADVDVNNKYITVSKSLDTNMELNSGKTKNAARTVPLQHAAIDVLNDQRAQLTRAGIISTAIFPDRSGNRFNPSSYTTDWSRLSSRKKIGVSLHELRHTFISICKSDMPLALLKQAVGHSASMDTIGVYGHAVEADVQSSINHIESAFGKTPK